MPGSSKRVPGSCVFTGCGRPDDVDNDMTKSMVRRGFFLMAVLAIFWLASGNPASALQPLVAVHDSELTRALESMPASGGVPTGAGTTGFQWWPTNWHYFVMPDAVKEALRSDGTAFTVVGDSNITSGNLLDGSGHPNYPILIS